MTCVLILAYLITSAEVLDFTLRKIFLSLP